MLEERVRGVIAQVFSLDKAAVTDAASQETIEKWDSLGHLNLLQAIEEEFRVNLPDNEIGDMTSLKSIVRILSGLVKQ